jgi:hypothetical protein
VGNRKGSSRDLFLIEIEILIEEKGFLIAGEDGLGDEVKDAMG